MSARTARTSELTKGMVSCEVIVLEALLSARHLHALKGVRAEACGRVIRLYGVDRGARRLAERLARAILGAEVVRFEDAA